ncbi:MAG: HAD hydrolase family protein [bacterium]|nr:HAD hydrolase family protein [bacterium]
MRQALKEKFSNVKLLALDFDGVMTVGSFVWTDQDGKEMVQSSRRDGLGILLLRKNGIQCVVISMEQNPVVAARCKKLEIECIQGVTQGKTAVLEQFSKKNNIPFSEIAYMGDDINDVLAMKKSGLALAVADAHPKAKAAADYVTAAEGGRGAVREVCEMILDAKGTKIDWQ